MKKLRMFLLKYGGQIIIPPDQYDIKQALASGRLWMDDDGNKFIWEPDVINKPELFEQFYPLDLVPEHLTAEYCLALAHKRGMGDPDNN